MVGPHGFEPWTDGLKVRRCLVAAILSRSFTTRTQVRQSINVRDRLPKCVAVAVKTGVN